MDPWGHPLGEYILSLVFLPKLILPGHREVIGFSLHAPITMMVCLTTGLGLKEIGPNMGRNLSNYET
jgi:hypothetical protein